MLCCRLSLENPGQTLLWEYVLLKTTEAELGNGYSKGHHALWDGL